ncbi:hypothetical protein MASR2M15_22690 [Anaerolineales bacterium]
MSNLIIVDNRYEFSDVLKDSFIGQGGMGTVFKGQDRNSQQYVAVKRLKQDLIQDHPDLVDRFVHEGEALSQLNHPNIVKMLTATQYQGIHYLVMEYVPGGSLRDVMDEHPQMNVQRVLQICLDLADALTRAHRLKILHRDIKPANVLIAEDGTPRLTDFGMARIGASRLTQSGTIVGTLSYLSPEALQGEELDERTDIWAFGVMMYEMLLGFRPFPDAAPGALVHSILTQQVQPVDSYRPDVPLALADLISRMLIRDRHQRIPSVRLVGAEIEAILRGDDSSMQMVVSTEPSRRFDLATPTPTAFNTAKLTAPNNLPQQPTLFIGREHEVKAVMDLLDKEEVQLVTLLEEGGVGKSRIAIEVGERLLTRYVDGVYYIPLSPIDRVEMIPPAIAEAIAYEFGQGDEWSQILAYLREKAVLLIIENYEQFIESANLIRDLAQETPFTKILLTSRERLRLRGEQIYEVSDMQIPPLDSDAASLSTYPAVQLFLQGAHRVMPDFVIDDQNAADIAKLIRKMNGLPLGIELASSWLEVLSIEEILEEITQSLDFLESNLQDVPERHRSLRAIFESSWNLLNSSEQDSLVRLSVFKGGFEREAAKKIADASLKELTSLVNKSLLSRDAAGRYLMSPLIQEYAREHLEEGDYQSTRQAHASYFMDFLFRMAPAISSEKEQLALDQIESEFDNIMFAWEYATIHKDWAAIDACVEPLGLFFTGRSRLGEGTKLLQNLYQQLEAYRPDKDKLYYEVANQLGWMYTQLGEYDQALQYARGALEFARKHQNDRELGQALNTLSYISMARGNLQISIDYVSEAVELAEKVDDVPAWFLGMANLGYALYLKGDLDSSLYVHEAIIKRRKENTNSSPAGFAYAINNFGEVQRARGHLMEAYKLFNEAYTLFKNAKLKRGMAFTLNNMAGLDLMNNEIEKAQEGFNQAYKLNKEIGDAAGIAHSLSALGNVALNMQQTEEARQYYEESLQVRRRMDDRKGMADSLNDLGRVNLETQDLGEAMYYFRQSLEIYESLADVSGQSMAMTNLGQSLFYRGDLVKAREMMVKALELAEQSGNIYYLGQITGTLGHIALNMQDLENAKRYFNRSLEICLQADFEAGIVWSVAGFSAVKVLEGDFITGLAYFDLVKSSQQLMPFIRRYIDEILPNFEKDIKEEDLAAAAKLAKKLTLMTVARDLLAEYS